MSRSLRALTLAGLLGSSLAGLAFVGVMSAACAASPQPDLTPEYDPTLPTVDASLESHPVVGSNGDDSAGAEKTNSGSKKDAAAPAANAEDAGATKTPTTPSESKPASGEVVVTEVMYATVAPEPMSEWFEVLNLASSARTLSGLTITDGGGRTHVIGAGVTLGPGAYGLLVRDKAAAIANDVPASAILYEYGAGLASNAGVLLANGATGGLSLSDGSERLASVPYGGWFTQSGGSSIQRRTTAATASESASGWCLSVNAWTSGSEKGTPGAANDCP